MLDSDHACSKCGASFSTRKDLQQHNETVHEGKKPYKCTLCEERFYQEFTLRKHIKTIHKSNQQKIIKKAMSILMTERNLSVQFVVNLL